MLKEYLVSSGTNLITKQLSGVEASNFLTANWAKTLEEENAVVSGAGVWVLLAALCQGAEGEALRELESATGVEGTKALETMQEVLEILEHSPSLYSALGIWVQDYLHLKQEWVEKMPKSSLGKLSGYQEHDQEILDFWAEQNTYGKISNFPLATNKETLMMLASAVGVSTTWREEFWEKIKTYDSGAWKGITATNLTVDSVYEDELRFLLSPIGPLTILQWHGNEDVDVHLFLGQPEISPGEVLSTGIFCATSPEATFPDCEEKHAPGISVERIESYNGMDYLEVNLPAFKIKSSHDLLKTPELFGLKNATDSSIGHFLGIAEEPLFVGAAKQEVVAEFKKDGFTAVSVTGTGMLAGSAMPQKKTLKKTSLVIDRPFGFAAIHRASKLCVFAGWVDRPE